MIPTFLQYVLWTSPHHMKGLHTTKKSGVEPVYIRWGLLADKYGTYFFNKLSNKSTPGLQFPLEKKYLRKVPLRF